MDVFVFDWGLIFVICLMLPWLWKIAKRTAIDSKLCLDVLPANQMTIDHAFCEDRLNEAQALSAKQRLQSEIDYHSAQEALWFLAAQSATILLVSILIMTLSIMFLNWEASKAWPISLMALVVSLLGGVSYTWLILYYRRRKIGAEFFKS